ncbi:transposase [Lacticaseibacillus absianus]|uniref:transposase n=1 Tax=Lacticaseibacillus absianus TaxID=2729623 RepID=UPI0015C7DA90|nr:transposase [Lacticaseibacillus absianus]
MVYTQQNQSQGASGGYPLNADNEWVELAGQLPWQALEAIYQLDFAADSGRQGTPFRQLYAAQLIKDRTGLTDRAVFQAIREVPAFQYFVGLTGYHPSLPFSVGSLAHFRRRIAPLKPILDRVIARRLGELIQAALQGSDWTLVEAFWSSWSDDWEAVEYLGQAALAELDSDQQLMAKQLSRPAVAPRGDRPTGAVAQLIEALEGEQARVEQLQAAGGHLSPRRQAVLTTIRALSDELAARQAMIARADDTPSYAQALSARTVEITHFQLGVPRPVTAFLEALQRAGGRRPSFILTAGGQLSALERAQCEAAGLQVLERAQAGSGIALIGLPDTSDLLMQIQLQQLAVKLESVMVSAKLGPLLSLYDGPLVLTLARGAHQFQLQYRDLPQPPLA